MLLTRTRLGGFTLLAFTLFVQGCGERHGSTSTIPPADVPTIKSVSPALIPAPPMARTAILPPSAMTSIRRPQSAISLGGFTQIPGGASFVAAAPDGSIWVLSNQGAGPDQSIWHYAGGAWSNISGGGTRLAVAPDNSIWVINAAGGIYHYTGSWTQIAGGASDISVGPDGSVYVISNQGGGPFGRGAWRYANGAWTQLPGGGVRVAASWDAGTYLGNITPGTLWVLNTPGDLWYWNATFGFHRPGGGGVEMAPTTNGGIFVLGFPGGPSGYPIWYNDLNTGTWTQQCGTAVGLTTSAAYLYIVAAGGGIYRAPLTGGNGSCGTPAAPVVGYLAPTTTGSFAGKLASVQSGATVVGISTVELPPDGSSGLTSDNLAFNLGSTVLSTGRLPMSVRAPQPSGQRHDLERPAETPDQIAALTSRLRHAPIGANRPLAVRHTSALGTTVGAHTQFWVSVFAIGSSSSYDIQVGATLEVVANNGYVWVDDGLVGTSAFNAATIAKLAADLDNAYASDTIHYGPTGFTASALGLSNGGYYACDNTGAQTGTVPKYVVPPDSKINAFVINTSRFGAGLGGYFTTYNYLYQTAWNCLIGKTPNGGGPAYTAQTIPHSNEAPLIYVGWNTSSSTSYETDEDLVRGTAHELQHLINFVDHAILNDAPSEDSWINEGMSMLSQDFAVNRKYGLAHDAADALYYANLFTSAPQNFALTAFFGIDAGQASPQPACSGCYGEAYLFQRYLYDRFGGDAYLHAMLGSQTGYAALQQATGTNPQTLISDFAIAVAASGTGATSDPRFGIATLSLPTAYPDQFGRTLAVGGPATTALPSSASPYTGTFAYYAVGANALNQNLSAKDLGGGFGLNVGVVQR